MDITGHESALKEKTNVYGYMYLYLSHKSLNKIRGVHGFVIQGIIVDCMQRFCTTKGECF